MMAPQVSQSGEWPFNWVPPIRSPQMLAAMDWDSTDGESSLLSYSGLDAGQMNTATSNTDSLTENVMKDALDIIEISAETPTGSPARNGNIATISSTDDGVNSEPSENLPKVRTDFEENLETGFYFESDHLALKGNSDYQVLLQTVAMLESQRTKGIKDLETLVKCKSEALQDPIAFVDKLQRKVDLGLPRAQSVYELPDIDWSYYTSSCDPSQFKQPKHLTRQLKQNAEEGPSRSTDLSTSSGYGSRPMTPIMSPCSAYTANSNGFNKSDHNLIRGRLKDVNNKSKTFNQLWTVDEQRHLEELLVKHQPEEVEMRRWEKIAKELGNRTATQVQSRVQKYFLKLAKSGLPIPGRTPYMPANLRKKHKHQHHRHQRFLYPSSTFLSSHEPPVYMGDDDDDSYSYTGSSVDYSDGNIGSQDGVSDDEAIPMEVRDREEYKELLRLKRLRRKKQHEINRTMQHLGFKCDRCDCEPIIGVRWHCRDCPAMTSVDFCDNCIDFVFETATHKSNHTVEPVKTAELANPQHDSDYARFMGGPGDYNYLDPNYMPAT